jgi:YVTN family beta-propeller protein
MSIVDTTSLTTVKRVGAGKSPWGVAVGPAPKM